MVNTGEYASPMDASWAKNAKAIFMVQVLRKRNPIRTRVGFAELVGGFFTNPLNKNMVIKLDHLPRGGGENKKYLKLHHLDVHDTPGYSWIFILCKKTSQMTPTRIAGAYTKSIYINLLSSMDFCKSSQEAWLEKNR